MAFVKLFEGAFRFPSPNLIGIPADPLKEPAHSHQAELSRQWGIALSTGSLSSLCDRFLTYLEALHLARVPQLRAALGEGYPLHIDATCEHGKGGLFVCMDGWRGWVLVAGRIPSEHEDHLRPLVAKTTRLFGDPIAIVRDRQARVAPARLPRCASRASSI